MIALLALATAATSQPTPLNDEVVIKHPMRPDDVVETVAGRCGRNHYQIRLEHIGNRTVLSVGVNDRRVAAAQIAKVTNAVPTGQYLYQPFVAECFRDRPNARMRLIVDGPSSHTRFQFLYFEVTPDGMVANVSFT